MLTWILWHVNLVEHGFFFLILPHGHCSKVDGISFFVHDALYISYVHVLLEFLRVSVPVAVSQ